MKSDTLLLMVSSVHGVVSKPSAWGVPCRVCGLVSWLRGIQLSEWSASWYGFWLGCLVRRCRLFMTAAVSSWTCCHQDGGLAEAAEAMSGRGVPLSQRCRLQVGSLRLRWVQLVSLMMLVVPVI